LSDTATGESVPNDPRPDDVTSLDLALVAARSADEKQGRNIVVLDVGPVLHITEFFVVIDAPNRRLVRTLVDEIEQSVRAIAGRSPLRTEGLKEHQWVLIDYGDVVVHVFLDEVRRFYEIERLYRDVASVAWADQGDGEPV
jgi:ribosome-associated protein